MPVRVALMPTSRIVRLLSGRAEAATSKKAAEEMSPGMKMLSGFSGDCGRSLCVVLPKAMTGASIERNMRSV